MRISRTAFLTLLCATTFWSCGTSDSSTTPNPTTTDGGWDEVRTFSILGRTGEGLILRYPESIHGSCGTQDSAGVGVQRVDVDTFPSRTDTLRLRLDGNDRMFQEGANPWNQGIEGLFTWWSEWRRVSGSGPSFEGVWNSNLRDTLEVADGKVPDSTFRRMQAESDAMSARYRDASLLLQHEFSSTSLVSRVRYDDPASIVSIHWDRYQKADYDLTLERLDARTLRYKGATETVTLTFLENFSHRYSSSDPSRVPYTLVLDPRKDSDCPEDPWFDEFLSSHHRSAQDL